MLVTAIASGWTNNVRCDRLSRRKPRPAATSPEGAGTGTCGARPNRDRAGRSISSSISAWPPVLSANSVWIDSSVRSVPQSSLSVPCPDRSRTVSSPSLRTNAPAFSSADRRGIGPPSARRQSPSDNGSKGVGSGPRPNGPNSRCDQLSEAVACGSRPRLGSWASYPGGSQTVQRRVNTGTSVSGSGGTTASTTPSGCPIVAKQIETTGNLRPGGRSTSNTRPAPSGTDRGVTCPSLTQTA